MLAMAWSDKLNERLEELGWSGMDLSRETGIPYANINKYILGKIEQPRGDALSKIAKAIGRPVPWLRGEAPIESDVSKFEKRLVPVPVVGTVEAGTFREVYDMDQSEPVMLSLPADDRFPNARLVAFDVSGDSMNDLKPRAILAGDRVVGVSYEDISHEAILRDQMIVIVERTRDGGHTREWSVKQLEIYADRTEFHPRSTNPKHKPIIVKRDLEADEGVSVEIVALVRRIVNDLPY